jgi:hypothetical protein
MIKSILVLVVIRSRHGGGGESMQKILRRGSGSESMKQTHCGGGGGENKQQPHCGNGESMQQMLCRGYGGGDKNRRQTHCGGGGGESRQQTHDGAVGSSAARVVTSDALPREIHQISLV